jgi:hypothetical protein
MTDKRLSLPLPGPDPDRPGHPPAARPAHAGRRRQIRPGRAGHRRAQPADRRAPTPAVGIRETVERDDIFAWWQGALGELHATVRAQGLTTTGSAGGLYASELFEYSRGEATVFIPHGERGAFVPDAGEWDTEIGWPIFHTHD